MFLSFYGKIEKNISLNKEDFLHREEERMKEPVLIVMAAGMGSRYGGLKQMDPVDVQGHAILDFSVYDAKSVCGTTAAAIKSCPAVFAVRTGVCVTKLKFVLNFRV